MKHPKDALLNMCFLGIALSVTAFQDDVACYTLSMASPKSVVVSSKRRACIPSSLVSFLMAM